MTDPSGMRGRRPRYGAYNPLRGLRRPLVAVAGLAIVVIAAVGLSLALSGGVPGPGSVPSGGIAGRTASPTANASGSVVVASSPPVASGSPQTTGSVDPSLALPSPSSPGLRATRIQITRLHIDLAIVEGDGIDAPIGKAAHYPGSGWPEGGTNIYIYAHARTGMFLSLWDAAIGDRVDLTLADGSKRTYVVDKILPKVPPDAVEYLQPTQLEQLTLQTSTGPNESDPRFVVIAHPGP